MEVREDLLLDNAADPMVRKEFLTRAYARYQSLLQSKVNFIDDSSADRSWKQKPDDQYFQLVEHGYDYFIISMDVSEKFITKLHNANKSTSRGEAKRYYEDHRTFLELYSNDVGVHITDQNFPDRMAICEQAAGAFIGQHH